ncbi:nitroreductase/quinone reductase family protein [Mycobacterium intracellulare]|uniref:nitroreductase/quinone reductase family protein n=1 Tax=Mycobacterium intracellulare TaxID=1767 RepID=UPI0027DF9A53|nr:nitroreductase/quinone reductase family protein [Mycobacterium intracellulare]MEE3754859.1 nitroreductase/quinone reductase family protein [Mycobacterium intracellulare]
MSFDNPKGTRGSRQPRASLAMQWFNNWAISRIRRSGKFMGGMDALVLTTVGRKTGAQRRTPVGYFPGGNDSWLVVASAAGAARNPAWYYNIAAHPDEVHIEVAGRKLAVTAEQLSGTTREEAWRQITAASPRFARYRQKTDRLLPVIRLVPRVG